MALIADGYELAVDEPHRVLTQRKAAQSPIVRGDGTSGGFITIETQYEFRVEGDNLRCSISATSFRAWQNSLELQEYEVDYISENTWGPLMSSIDREMRQRSAASE